MQHEPIPVKIEAFHALFTQVAAQLGGFTYTPEPWTYGGTPHAVAGHLTSQTETANLYVHLSLSTYAPTLRAEVRGVYPRTAKGSQYQHDSAPRIGFVITRDAKTIAGDIRRRFMPNYKLYHAKAVAYAQEWQAAEDRQADVKKQMIAVGFDFRNYEFQGYSTAPSAIVEINQNYVDLKLRQVSPEDAAQIINFLKPAA